MAQTQAIVIPDIGTFNKVAVIEVNIKPGDVVSTDDTLITLESDKASMEIPSPFTGKIKALHIKLGDKVSTGSMIADIETETAASNGNAAPETKVPAPVTAVEPEQPQPIVAATSVAKIETAVAPISAPSTVSNNDAALYASPIVRRLAREFGVDLTQVTGSAHKGRISRDDVQQYVKTQLQKIQTGQVSAGTGSGLPTMPEIDFSQFGPVDVQELSRINKLSATYLHRNWVVIPHVTQFEEANITEMEAFRKAQGQKQEKDGVKLTPLVFLMKAAVAALKQFPRFNTSLAPDGSTLFMKKYYNIGVAVDTPNGLVVPVIKQVDQKSLLDLAKELGEISIKARAGKLTSADMQGGCFSISSLGGIGGTAFTPIINAPDVAILGVSKAQMKPIYQNDEFVPQLMLPLSLSYDHRVIDGALAAKFITYFSELLADIRRLLL